MSGGSSAGSPRVAGRGNLRAGWWAVFAVVALVVIALAWQPWTSVGSAAGMPPLPTGGAVPTATPAPTPTPTPVAPEIDPSVEAADTSLMSTSRATVPSAAPFPGSSTVFDQTSALELFVTADQVASAVPAAGAGLVPRAGATWGLPTAAIVSPGSCLVARTVVTRTPAGFVARSWAAGDVRVEQQAVLLDDPPAARAAFAQLVERVDGCPQITQSGPGAGTWLAQPAIEGQGLYPSIVQDIGFSGLTRSTHGTRGHLLVGNAIVTWSAQTSGDVDELGSPADLEAIMQERALAAVRATG